MGDRIVLPGEFAYIAVLHNLATGFIWRGVLLSPGWDNQPSAKDTISMSYYKQTVLLLFAQVPAWLWCDEAVDINSYFMRRKIDISFCQRRTKGIRTNERELGGGLHQADIQTDTDLWG